MSLERRVPSRCGKKFLGHIWRNDPYVRGFDHDLKWDCSALTPAAEALFESDPGAFRHLERTAWRDRDLKTCLALADVMRRRRALNPKSAGRAVFVLLAAGRSQDALDLLRRPASERPEAAGYWLDLSRAFAGVGELERADTAVTRAMSLDPRLQAAQELGARLSAALRAKALAPAAEHWSDLEPGFEALVALGLRDRAARLLYGFLAREPAPFGEREAVEKAILDLLEPADPETVRRALKALSRVRRKPKAVSEIKATLKALTEPGTPPPRPAALAPEDRDLEYVLGFACGEARAWPAAIERLGRLRQADTQDLRAGPALARCIGSYVLEQHPLRFSAFKERRVFNLVPFNNELMLLRARIEEMAGWVDAFVIVESAFTFTGRPKPLHFACQRAQFAPYAGKLLHVVVDRFPEFMTTPWARDCYQRDMAVTALSGVCAERDLVLLTDADEIVRREAVEGFEGEFGSLRMETYRYCLNHRLAVGRSEQRGAGAIWRAGYLSRHGSSYARFVLSHYDPSRYIHDAGWHFTSIGDAARIAAKMKSYAHTEYAHRDEAFFRRVLARISRGRIDEGWEVVAVDPSFPTYIQRNRRELGGLVLDCPPRAPEKTVS